jgi:hypothetical protein
MVVFKPVIVVVVGVPIAHGEDQNRSSGPA